MTQLRPAAPARVVPELSAGLHVGGLDGLRALAALAVLTTHVSFTTGAFAVAPLGPVMARLDIGVALFFLLSGFLLYRPWALDAMGGRARTPTRTYALRRAARILPAYWLVVVVTFLVLPGVGGVATGTWLSHLALLQIYPPFELSEGLTQMWSLATEAAFYVVLPLLGWLLTRRHRGDPDRSARAQLGGLGMMALVGVAVVVARAAGPLAEIPASGYWLPHFLDWFALGMMLAVVSARRSVGPTRARWLPETLAADTTTCLVVAGAVFLALCTPLGGSYGLEWSEPWAMVVKHVGYGVVCLLLLAPVALHPGGAGAYHRFLEHPVTARLGLISYGIFLWHLVLLQLVLDAAGVPPFTGGFWWVWPVTVAVTCAAATGSYLLVERPALRWAHRR